MLMKLISKEKGRYIYQSNKKVQGTHSRNRTYLIERDKYPCNLWYYPAFCGVVPMHYTWQVSVIDRDEYTGKTIYLKDRGKKACAYQMQSSTKSTVLGKLKAIDNEETNDPFINDYKAIHNIYETIGSE